MSKSVLHVDLHPIAKQGRDIDAALEEALSTAKTKRLKTIEIIPGKGSGQLMKRVMKWLERKPNKLRYKRVDVDEKNHGRLFVYVR